MAQVYKDVIFRNKIGMPTSWFGSGTPSFRKHFSGNVYLYRRTSLRPRKALQHDGETSDKTIHTPRKCAYKIMPGKQLHRRELSDALYDRGVTFLSILFLKTGVA